MAIPDSSKTVLVTIVRFEVEGKGMVSSIVGPRPYIPQIGSHVTLGDDLVTVYCTVVDVTYVMTTYDDPTVVVKLRVDKTEGGRNA